MFVCFLTVSVALEVISSLLTFTKEASGFLMKFVGNKKNTDYHHGYPLTFGDFPSSVLRELILLFPQLISLLSLDLGQKIELDNI